MSHCCCKPERVISHECLCCLNDEINLYKLKNTNTELKSLINRLDQLSGSVETSYLKHKCKNYSTCSCSCNCNNINGYSYDLCNLCKSLRERNNKHYYVYDLTICNDCERMVRLSNELETKNSFKTDPRIYPLTTYPSGKQYHCDKCEKCVYESRSRSRGRRSRNSSPYSSRPVTPEPRPSWNGGPWTSYYPWTNWKLKESKN